MSCIINNCPVIGDDHNFSQMSFMQPEISRRGFRFSRQWVETVGERNRHHRLMLQWLFSFSGRTCPHHFLQPHLINAQVSTILRVLSQAAWRQQQCTRSFVRQHLGFLPVVRPSVIAGGGDGLFIESEAKVAVKAGSVLAFCK